jgi:DNA polymerase-1
VTWDENPAAFYVPAKLANDGWLSDTVRKASRWVNHNVKFDAHFAAVDGAKFDCELWDTTTLAKLLDSDRYSHGLKELVRDWLGRNTETEDRVATYLKGYKLPHGKRARNFALVPTDILGAYACDDVLHNRALFQHIMRELPSGVEGVLQTEVRLTPVLWDMEHRGLQVDRGELMKESYRSTVKMIDLAQRITDATGLEYVDSSQFSYGVLCNTFGLPILKRDKKTGNPSFDKEALTLYLGSTVDELQRQVIKDMLAMRKEQTYYSLFLESWLEKAPESVIHSSYNQIIRTGRMSSRDPNSQQMSKRAKALIHPREGYKFVMSDASQIEFRVIAYYIGDEEVLAAYRDNPRVDFHQWVADICRVKRKPAKTINFAMAYGAGKKTTLSQLEVDPDLMEEFRGHDQHTYRRLCRQRAADVYSTYHDKLPGIKITANAATRIAKRRGWVFNAYGRRRHLPAKAAHVAFNTLCQGTAMDYIKRKMIQLCPRYGGVPEDVHLVVNVHDELLWEVPKDMAWDPTPELERPDGVLTVPICWDTEERMTAWHEK